MVFLLDVFQFIHATRRVFLALCFVEIKVFYMLFFHDIEPLPRSLYLHFPACTHVCSYCDFNVYSRVSLEKNWGPDWQARWVEGISRHLGSVNAHKLRPALETIYLGGGTPGLLESEILNRLVKVLDLHFDLNSIREWTIECNPENISKEKIADFKSVGINRVSMGVQSFREKSLKRLERLSTAKKVFVASDLLAQSFDRWTLDLMLGVPEQGLSELELELKELQKISPPHFSAYLLSLPEDHKWYRSKMKSLIPDADSQLDHFLMVDRWAESSGYTHYELSNYAKPGGESRHNSIYWDPEKYYLAYGPGAHGYIRKRSGERIRYEMLREPKAWADSEDGVGWKETLTAEQQKIERLYLSLRTRKRIHDEPWSSIIEQTPELKSVFSKDFEGFQLMRDHWPIMDHIALQLMQRS